MTAVGAVPACSTIRRLRADQPPCGGGGGEEGWGGLADGKLYRWKLIGTDPGGDVAIIQLDGEGVFPYAPLADSETVRVGDWAMAMGNPFVLAEDQHPTVTLGIVSGVHRFQAVRG